MAKMRVYGDEKKMSMEKVLSLIGNDVGMSEKDVKKIVDLQIKKNKLLDKLKLGDWSIKIDYGNCESEAWAAQCAQDPAYKIAYIRINPEMHETEEEVKESLLHELMHVVVSPVESFFMVQLAGITDESSEQGRQMEHWRQSNEQLVCRLTQLYMPLLG